MRSDSELNLALWQKLSRHLAYWQFNNLDWDFKAEYKLSPDTMQTDSGFIWPWLTYWLTYAVCWQLNICSLFNREISVFIHMKGLQQCNPYEEENWACTEFWEHWKCPILNSLLNWSLLCWEKNEEQWSNVRIRWGTMPSSCLLASVFHRGKVSKQSVMGWFWRSFLAYILSLAFLLLIELSGSWHV